MHTDGNLLTPIEFLTDNGAFIIYGWNDLNNEGISIWYRPNEEDGEEIEIADVGEV